MFLACDSGDAQAMEQQRRTRTRPGGGRITSTVLRWAGRYALPGNGRQRRHPVHRAVARLQQGPAAARAMPGEQVSYDRILYF
jgi:hypothetical protein